MEINEVWREAVKDIEIDEEKLKNIVAEYLLLEGHFEALNEFVKSSGAKVEGNLCNEKLEALIALKKAIVENKDMDEATGIFGDNFPDEAALPILMQEYLDLLAQSKRPEALEYARKYLQKIIDKDPDSLQEFKHISALIAFEEELDQTTPPWDHLLKDSHRLETVRKLVANIQKKEGFEKREPDLVSIVKKLIYLTNWWEKF